MLVVLYSDNVGQSMTRSYSAYSVCVSHLLHLVMIVVSGPAMLASSAQEGLGAGDNGIGRLLAS